MSLDYDWKGQKVFWVSLEMDAIMWSSLEQKMTGSLIKGSYNSNVAGVFRGMVVYCHVLVVSRHKMPLVSTGVRADSIAVDWVGRNLYWINGVKSRIVAIRLAAASASSLGQSIILDEDLDQPRSLALLPQKGLI